MSGELLLFLQPSSLPRTSWGAGHCSLANPGGTSPALAPEVLACILSHGLPGGFQCAAACELDVNHVIL